VSYQGTLIGNISVKFEEAASVEAKASRGEESLKRCSTPTKARAGSAMAAVPHPRRSQKAGWLFFNTLFDENAASHIALGQFYSKCFCRWRQADPQQIAAQGGNRSLIHIDWRSARTKTDIDGIHADGRSLPVFRKASGRSHVRRR